MISLEHSRHGDAVTYRVDPSLELLLRAIFVMALASACSTYGLVTPAESSHTFSKPAGVPLNPSDIIVPSKITAVQQCAFSVIFHNFSSKIPLGSK